MWGRKMRTVAALAVAALTMSACWSSDEAQVEVAVPEADDEQVDGTDGAEKQVPADDGADDTGTADDATADDGAEETRDRRAGAWPDPIEVDVIGRHPGGFVVEIFEVRSNGPSTDLDVRLTNGQSDWDISLNFTGAPTELRDDTGVTYPLVPPDDNRVFAIGRGEVVEGTMTFSGPLSPDATSLTLEFNSSATGDSELATTPNLLIEDIPLVGGDA